MSNIDDGGPAFPGGDGPMAGNPQYYAPGMSLRDFIATAAMEKIVSPQAWSLDGAFNQKVYDNTAQHAYRYADAMLAARTPTPATETEA